MQTVETIIVGLILLGAALYLYKTFKPKPNGGGCSCGTVDCKVPKPKIRNTSEKQNEH